MLDTMQIQLMAEPFMYNAVGIDASKLKSTVTVIQPTGVVVRKPFDVLHMVRSCKGIEMLVNLINISYCAMKILPYQSEHFSEYRAKSVQEFRFELSQSIRSQIFFATFVKNIEAHIKSAVMTKALKQLIHQQIYHL